MEFRRVLFRSLGASPLFLTNSSPSAEGLNGNAIARDRVPASNPAHGEEFVLTARQQGLARQVSQRVQFVRGRVAGRLDRDLRRAVSTPDRKSTRLNTSNTRVAHIIPSVLK